MWRELKWTNWLFKKLFPSRNSTLEVDVQQLLCFRFVVSYFNVTDSGHRNYRLSSVYHCLLKSTCILMSWWNSTAVRCCPELKLIAAYKILISFMLRSVSMLKTFEMHSWLKTLTSTVTVKVYQYLEDEIHIILLKMLIWTYFYLCALRTTFFWRFFSPSYFCTVTFCGY